MIHSSQQSRHNFGEQVCSVFFVEIMAVIFDFNGSRRLGRERNLYQGGEQWSIIRRWVGVITHKLLNVDSP